MTDLSPAVIGVSLTAALVAISAISVASVALYRLGQLEQSKADASEVTPIAECRSIHADTEHQLSQINTEVAVMAQSVDWLCDVIEAAAHNGGSLPTKSLRPRPKRGKGP